MHDHRRDRLHKLIRDAYEGDRRRFCAASGLSESRLAQLLSHSYRDGSGFGERAARTLESALALPAMYFDLGVLSSVPQQTSIEFERGPTSAADALIAGMTPIRKVKLRLSPGTSRFSFARIEEDGSPIFFGQNWLSSRGFKPEKLMAIEIHDESMESGLFSGDTVVVNTAENEPRDGSVYAINYEGEALVKRLVRDSGEWWLLSDNPDQRRFPRKKCDGDNCIIIGRVVYKQSERV